MSEPRLRRYTTLPFLLDILEHKRLTLSDPKRWEDQNDYAYLKAYKAQCKLRSLFVLCFAEAPELFSHWKVYAGSSSGVCIEFDKRRLLRFFPEGVEIKRDYVKYETFEGQKARRVTLDELPFIKRYGFIDDREYRIVCCSNNHKLNKYIPISLNCISMIIFSPWTPKEVTVSIEQVIRKINVECKHIPIRKSTLTDSRRWTNILENLELRISH